MVRTRLIIGAIALIVVASCNKNLPLNPVSSFEVTTSSITYNVGDTVNFNFKGNPDNISFYSGLSGNKYDSSSMDSTNFGIPIKNITQVVTSFSYVFTAPGTDTVVFLATSATPTKEISVTREVYLTIQ